MKHKLPNQIALAKSVRKVWGFVPVTRVVKSKAKYTRKIKHKNQDF